MASITFKGKPLQTSGELPAEGSKAPDFTLTDKNLKDHALSEFEGRKVLNIVPSLETPVCAAQARRFNEEAAKLDNATVLVVSADLPFAQGRFCSTENIEGLTTLSTMRSPEFARDYGIRIEDGPLAGLCARAVLVLDSDNSVLHAQLVPEIGEEPDYEAALAALRQ